jgi:hypothetical protein
MDEICALQMSQYVSVNVLKKEKMIFLYTIGLLQCTGCFLAYTSSKGTTSVVSFCCSELQLFLNLAQTGAKQQPVAVWVKVLSDPILFLYLGSKNEAHLKLAKAIGTTLTTQMVTI